MKFTTNANSNLENGSETAILIDRALEHSSALHVSKKKCLQCATICLQFHFRDQIEEWMIYSAMVTQFQKISEISEVCLNIDFFTLAAVCLQFDIYRYAEGNQEENVRCCFYARNVKYCYETN